ncbi:hypothetical protein CLV30_102177 [Haloactinopolyspora alba]|uniref:Uncharacterized protein n=1 Tax=Haloactinopolyspora alba TaxID=648780 RepID=A0A2P8EBE0_9ACTN|nr:hypothetical protein [Haloactinopolyspora alba]PSL06789.1 hypothetical protein CLV30_102177 [Haloactinopolyspora alba]
MTDNAPPPHGVETAPDSASTPRPPSDTPPVHNQPDEQPLPDIHTQPDYGQTPPVPEDQPDHVEFPDIHNQPDHVDLQPDYEVETPIGRPPILEPPVGCFPQPTREELEMALHRAQLVVDELSSLLDPALKAMEDGAWVSRRADEFSGGLTEHARQTGATAERCLDTIQEALDNHGDDNVVEPRPL